MMASEDVNLDTGQMVEMESSNALSSLEEEDAKVIQDEVNKPNLSPDDDNMETVCLDTEKTTESENIVDPTDSNLESDTKELLNERDKLSAELTEKNLQLNAFETELSSLKSKVEALETEKSQILADHEKLHLQNESLNVKVNELKKHYIAANKEKESMVVKYAIGEKEVILQTKAKEETERKLQAVLKERDEANAKVKNLISERSRLQQTGDARYQDVVVLKKEVERWKEEAKVQEAKAVSMGSQLKVESDSHRETRANLETTIKQLAETRLEIEKTRDECHDFMKKFRDEENARNKKAEKNAKEERVKLMIDEAAATELESFRAKYKTVIEENNSFSIKIQKFEKDRLDYDANLGKLKEMVESQKQEIVDLMDQVAEMESLRMQLQRVEERSEERQAEIERLRSEAVETLADMAACRAKEAELLEFTQKLTDKNVTLQSDLACLESKSSNLESDHVTLSCQLKFCEEKLNETIKSLDKEKQQRKVETELLAKKLAELTKQAETSNQKVLDAENDLVVLKRKHASSLRELTRELQSCKKQLDHNDNAGSRLQRRSPSGLSSSSRASSNTSLNRMSEENDNVVIRQSNNHLSVPSSQASSNGIHEKAKDAIVEGELMLQIPETQILIDKILKLQSSLARKQEKVEFMEDHVSTLIDEMKKKNKLLQHYILQEETGVLASASMDENKARTSAHGGIMASLYSSKQSDNAMTLELSLEINQKLQAVLEDTLLKNITLKENINTLGQEIATLSNRGSSKK